MLSMLDSSIFLLSVVIRIPSYITFVCRREGRKVKGRQRKNELGAPRAEERKKKGKPNQRPRHTPHAREATTTQHEGGKRGKRSLHIEETSIERTPIISFRRKREVKQEVLSLLSSLFDVFVRACRGHSFIPWRLTKRSFCAYSLAIRSLTVVCRLFACSVFQCRPIFLRQTNLPLSVPSSPPLALASRPF